MKPVNPSKVICIGRNYAAHIAELGNQVADEMVVFLKPPSAITNTLMCTHKDEQLHFETEICFQVNNGCLAAVAVGLDLTKRDLQSKLKASGLPWERAKAFDGSALFSEFVQIDEQAIEHLSLTLLIDNKVRQQGGVELMLYKPAVISAQVSEFMTLIDGDIIMTGTPAGVGAVNAGSTFIAQLHLGSDLLIQQEWLAE
ncbi:fumarylacetoacetate hydrolase family protein [Pseudoalteromonas sp. SR44-5]|uniref:fumarylacetoacetate hydrolase family protein n=1 Tax=Pseudoalteromonas sp. SR44-5 TaxID=2760934 RepID=UPI00160168E6|nr:fumarylacetoacetate hydrolase family protein [Pseudoalteromonas sp. SR44-5]MBB1366890.1 fumarylacetoacetate hydrolase family protein [Pseudoalteromonas sp. SR44-5]